MLGPNYPPYKMERSDFAPPLFVAGTHPHHGMPPKKVKGPASAPKREDALSRHYPKLEDGSSVFGLEEYLFNRATREHVLGNRSDWKFYALSSFCHTFRAVLRLPAFTGDQLERSLVDPAKHVLTLEVSATPAGPDPLGFFCVQNHFREAGTREPHLPSAC